MQGNYVTDAMLRQLYKSSYGTAAMLGQLHGSHYIYVFKATLEKLQDSFKFQSKQE